MSRRVAPLRKAPLLGYHVMASRAAVAPPFSPTDIAGLKLWIDFSDADTLFTDAGSTKVSADGDAIYQANDKSGLGNHILQSTLGYRPLYKSNIQNGLSAGLSDGTDDYLSRGDALGFTGNPAVTMICVTKSPTDSSDISGILSMGKIPTAAGTTVLHAVAWGANDYAAYFFGNGNQRFSLSSISYNTTLLTTWARASGETYGDTRLFINGDEKTPSAQTNPTNTVNLADNHLWLFAGATANQTAPNLFDAIYIMEALVYNSELSDDDRQAVETYLNDKWNVYEPAKSQSLEGMLSFEPEEEKLWWQGADVDVLAQAQPQVELTWWDKANRVVNAALAKAKKFIDDKLYQLWQALEDYFTYDEEE